MTNLNIRQVMEATPTGEKIYIKKSYNNTGDIHVMRQETIDAKEKLLACYNKACNTVNYDLIDDMNTLINYMDVVIDKLAAYYGSK